MDKKRLEKYARIYLEYSRFQSEGPIGNNLHVLDRDIVLCLGLNPSVTLTQTDISKIFNQYRGTTYKSIVRLVKEDILEVGVLEDDGKKKKPLKLSNKGKEKYHSLIEFLYNNAQYNPINNDKRID